MADAVRVVLPDLQSVAARLGHVHRLPVEVTCEDVEVVARVDQARLHLVPHLVSVHPRLAPDLRVVRHREIGRHAVDPICLPCTGGSTQLAVLERPVGYADGRRAAVVAEHDARVVEGRPVVAARVEERGVAAHDHPLHLHLGPHAVPADDARVHGLLPRGLRIADELVRRFGHRAARRQHPSGERERAPPDSASLCKFHRVASSKKNV